MELTKENIIFIRTVYNEMRSSMEKFQKERNFVMTNSQLFTFLTYSPAVLAISSDGVVDQNEIAVLEKISRSLDVKSTVSLDLAEMMSVATEPENGMSNEEFNLRAGAELLYLCRESKIYKSDIIKALKAMLTFDMTPKAEGSMSSSFSALMDSMIENGISKDKEFERKELAEIKKQLGI